MGTVSFIEPTRPEYKILAVHFRDEITSSSTVAGVFGNSTEGRGGGEGLGRDIRLLVARESGGRSRRSGGEEGGQKGWLSTTTVGDLRRGPPCVVVAVIWN